MRTLHSLKRLELKFGLSPEFFDKIPVRTLLDVLFRVFRFSKVFFTEGCHGNFVTSHVKLQIIAEISHQN